MSQYSVGVKILDARCLEIRVDQSDGIAVGVAVDGVAVGVY